MKFLASLFSFFALASAQALYISSPTPGQNVPLDTYLIVEIYSNEIFSENVCFQVAFRYFIAYSLKNSNQSISSFTQLNSRDLVPISNITIGIVHCPESGCPVPSNVTHVDYVLYDGPYTPTASGRGYYHNFYYLAQVSSFSNGNGEYLLYLKSLTTTSIDSDSSDVSGSHISECV